MWRHLSRRYCIVRRDGDVNDFEKKVSFVNEEHLDIWVLAHWSKLLNGGLSPTSEGEPVDTPRFSRENPEIFLILLCITLHMVYYEAGVTPATKHMLSGCWNTTEQKYITSLDCRACFGNGSMR